jgi:hypothetical protein
LDLDLKVKACAVCARQSYAGSTIFQSLGGQDRPSWHHACSFFLSRGYYAIGEVPFFSSQTFLFPALV